MRREKGKILRVLTDGTAGKQRKRARRGNLAPLPPLSLFTLLVRAGFLAAPGPGHNLNAWNLELSSWKRRASETHVFTIKVGNEEKRRGTRVLRAVTCCTFSTFIGGCPRTQDKKKKLDLI